MNAFEKTWVWRVEFARWTSPESSALTVNVLAISPAEASRIAQEAAREQWRDDAKDLEVLRVSRMVPIHGPALPTREARLSALGYDAKRPPGGCADTLGLAPAPAFDDCRDAEGSTTVVPGKAR